MNYRKETINEVREIVEDMDRAYVKSKHVAKYCDLDHHIIGTALRELEGDVVELWSKGNDYTWRVL